MVTGQRERCLESEENMNDLTKSDQSHGGKMVVGFFKEITQKERRTECVGRKVL